MPNVLSINQICNLNFNEFSLILQSKWKLVIVKMRMLDGTIGITQNILNLMYSACC